jgi:hypothetical protein
MVLRAGYLHSGRPPPGKPAATDPRRHLAPAPPHRSDRRESLSRSAGVGRRAGAPRPKHPPAQATAPAPRRLPRIHPCAEPRGPDRPWSAPHRSAARASRATLARHPALRGPWQGGGRGAKPPQTDAAPTALKPAPSPALHADGDQGACVTPHASPRTARPHPRRASAGSSASSPHQGRPRRRPPHLPYSSQGFNKHRGPSPDPSPAGPGTARGLGPLHNTQSTQRSRRPPSLLRRRRGCHGAACRCAAGGGKGGQGLRRRPSS